MVQQVRQHFSYVEYLALEEVSTVKHEFLDGQVWAMAGGSPDHAAVAANIVALLSNQLRGKPCRVYGSDLRVRVKATGLGTYPDVTVVCDSLETDEDDASGHTATNPRLIVEVLSPSTEDYDRGEKLTHYRQITSLEEVVLVAHHTQRVDVWRRDGDKWSQHTAEDAAAATLRSLDCELPLEEIYRDPLAG